MCMFDEKDKKISASKKMQTDISLKGGFCPSYYPLFRRFHPAISLRRQRIPDPFFGV